MAEDRGKKNDSSGFATPGEEQGGAMIERLLRERDAALQSASESHRQLRSSEELLLSLFNTALDGICLIEDRKVYFVNPRLCEMLGSDAAKLVGNDFTDFIADDDLVRTQQMYRRMMRSEAFPQRYETTLISPHGERIEVGVHADRVLFHGRESLMLRIRDVSAHRQARKMAVENERLEAVLTVAHSVGSNFANALSIIRNQAAIIVDSALPHSRPHEAAHQVLEAAEHAAELTKRLLSVVRMSGSDASVHVEPVSLHVSLQKARDLLMAGLEERNVKLVMDLDPRPWYVLADAGQLLDVLMNVFLNAADAMPQGGAISVHVDQYESTQAGNKADERSGCYVCVTVTDSGEGMSETAIAKVFEPFYTTRTNKHSYGLGLPVSQQMLKRWGGYIEISSEMDVGTVVRLFLPKAGDVAGEGSHLDGVRIEDRTLLVVEDNPDRRHRMVDVLRAEGFKILEADNGDQAIDLFQEHRGHIALTVLDWVIPGMDGGTVLQTIQDTDPDARILLISGFSKDYVRSQIKRGAWAYLQKPFSDADFLASVERVLPAPRCVLPVAEGDAR